jgi:hypothetical protein
MPILITVKIRCSKCDRVGGYTKEVQLYDDVVIIPPAGWSESVDKDSVLLCESCSEK